MSGAGVGQGVDGVAEFKFRLADLHAQTFRFGERRLGPGDLLMESIEPAANRPGRSGAGQGGPVLARSRGN